MPPTSPAPSVRLSSSYGLASIFYPASKALVNADRPTLNATRIHGDTTLTWTGRCALDDSDQSVLLGALALLSLPASPQPTDNDDMQAARLALKERAGGDAPYPDLWGFVEIGELARILDWKGGLSRVRIRGCLDRLAEVRVLSSTPTARWWNDLLSTYENKVTGRLVVQVDPTLARAVLFPTQQHVNYSMAERRELRSTGKVAHVWLSSWLQPAHQKTIHLETLYDHVWPDEDVAPSTHRSRRARLVQALEELRGVGWTITEEKGKPLVIRRPAAPRRVGSRHPTPGAFRPAVPQSVFNPNPYITIEEYEARSSATAWTPSARV